MDKNSLVATRKVQQMSVVLLFGSEARGFDDSSQRREGFWSVLGLLYLAKPRHA